MMRKFNRMIQTPALRIAILAILVLSLVGLGWALSSSTNSDYDMNGDYNMMQQGYTPAPTVTVTSPPKVITKKVPGPRKTIYVSRAKTRTHTHPAVAPHVAPGGVAACIRKWESGGNYTAQNPTSTASGAYQFLDSTWQGVTGLSGRAMHYSPAIQDKAFYKLWANGAGANQWVTAYHCV